MKGKYMPCSNFSHVRLENPALMDTLDGKLRDLHGFSIAMFDYLVSRETYGFLDRLEPSKITTRTGSVFECTQT